jgi:Arc/MetJ-type ribon-helix-helix transcriptional regulator
LREELVRAGVRRLQEKERKKLNEVYEKELADALSLY